MKMPIDPRALLFGHGTAAVHPSSGGAASVVALCACAALVLVLLAVVAFAAVRHPPEPRDDEGDSGHGRGNGGGRGPDPRPPRGGGPAWWPEFERQFAAHVEGLGRRRPHDVERVDVRAS